MTETITDALRGLLEGLLDETDEEEVHFKLRTALQLLFVVEERFEGAREALGEADLDEDLRTDLRALGYLD